MMYGCERSPSYNPETVDQVWHKLQKPYLSMEIHKYVTFKIFWVDELLDSSTLKK